MTDRYGVKVFRCKDPNGMVMGDDYDDAMDALHELWSAVTDAQPRQVHIDTAVEHAKIQLVYAGKLKA